MADCIKLNEIFTCKCGASDWTNVRKNTYNGKERYITSCKYGQIYDITP